jgi:uncharacterized membrane protein
MRAVMSTGRLEAFSDGVIAIIITIMVLELKVPRGDTFAALLPLIPIWLSYVLSFAYVGIYWNNHHHMLHAAEGVTGGILWANLHLLFWLSLFPVTTAWVGENPAAPAPSALYGIVLLMAAIAYVILQQFIIGAQGPDSRLSPFLYLAGIGAAFWSAAAAQLLYVAVALLWLVPDKRIERAMGRP